MLTILTIADLRHELTIVHEERQNDAMAWDAYCEAVDLLNDAIVSIRDLDVLIGSRIDRFYGVLVAAKDALIDGFITYREFFRSYDAASLWIGAVDHGFPA